MPTKPKNSKDTKPEVIKTAPVTETSAGATPKKRATAHRPAQARPQAQLPVPEVFREEIAKLAYQLWISGGQRHGRADLDWLEAERTVTSKYRT